MKKVIVFGTGDISQIAHLYLSEDADYEVVAFTMDKEYIKDDTFFGLPVVAFENLEEKFSPNEYQLFIPLSYTKVNKLREQKFLEAKEKGYRFIHIYIQKQQLHQMLRLEKIVLFLKIIRYSLL